MNKKIICVLFAVLLVCSTLVGCKKEVGTPEDNAVQAEETEEMEDAEEIVGSTIGYSCGDVEDPYHDTLYFSIKTAIRESENTIVFKNAENDINRQLQQIQELIDAHVAAVILCPVDWEKITPGLEALEEAGIPVVNVDVKVKEDTLITAFVGANNKSAGYACGQNLAKQNSKGGKIVILESPSKRTINERITGFEEAIAKAETGFQVLARVQAEGDKETAKESIKKVFEEQSHIDAIMCGNDQMALGVLEAAQEMNRTEIQIYSVEGSPQVKAELAKADSLIVGTGALSPINVGKKAVETMLLVMDEESYNEQIVVDSFFIDKESVKMYGTNGWQ